MVNAITIHRTYDLYIYSKQAYVKVKEVVVIPKDSSMNLIGNFSYGVTSSVIAEMSPSKIDVRI